MDCEDDKKWFKDKEERVPSFIGAAVRLQPRTPTPAHTALCFLRPKKNKSCQQPRQEFFCSLPLSLLSGRVATDRRHVLTKVKKVLKNAKS
jgi:hypothetical protein|tara:strand:+ start:432 stop:704 length:273 start_codon:yes stop_codon:yes gene_type:complete